MPNLLGPRTSKRLTWCLSCLLGVALVTRSAPAASPQQVDEAIKKGVEWLYAQQKEGGHWEAVPEPEKGDPFHWHDPKQGQWGGYTAISTYALLASGESHTNPKLKKAIENLAVMEIKGVYALGMRAQIYPYLPQTPPVRQAIMRDAKLLGDALKLTGKARGLYDYYDSKGGRYDHSVSQYGVLGMWALTECKVEPGENYWRLVDEAWRKNQYEDGGWSYIYDEERKTTMPMTTAGVATLYITRDQLYRNAGIGGGVTQVDENIEAGLKWVSANFKDVASLPNKYYTLYGIERIGVASGAKYFGTLDWYAEGADHLVKTQAKAGNWGGVPDTCFALLFLSRGRAPVMMNKLSYVPETGDPKRKPSPAQITWNQRPRDVASLAHWLSKQTERFLNWQVVNLQVEASELSDAPILYISGSTPLNFSPEHQAKLKLFVENGGLILGHADLSRKEFADSFKKLGQTLFPMYEFRQVPSSHPIYTTQQFKLTDPKKTPPLLGLSNGARELMLLLPTGDPARFWQLEQYVNNEETHELAANIFLYSVERQGLRNKGETHIVTPSAKIAADRKLKIARLEYPGNWDPEPGAWRRLASIMHNEALTDLDVQAVKLGASRLDRSYRAAHLTGTAAFQLDDKARQEIKNYVNAGGTLIVDAAGGSTEFALAFAKEMALMFPGQTSKPLPVGHAIYASLGQPITETTLRTFARKTLGADKHPRLHAIELSGRAAVIISAEDLTVGLVGQPVDGILGYEPDAATRLMSSALLYAAGAKLSPDDLQRLADIQKGLPTARPIDISKDVAKFSSGWTIVRCGNASEPGLKADWAGKKNVLVTHPVSASLPVVMSKKIEVPARRKMKLNLLVGRHKDGDWNLVVKLDGKQVIKQNIDATSAPEGWAEIPVDLSTFSGKAVTVEITHSATGWNHEEAYWGGFTPKLE